MIERFLDLQGQELEIRSHELELEFQREKNHKAVAETSIKANLEDRANHRGHVERVSKLNTFGVICLFIIASGVVCYCLYLGKEALLIKSVEVIGLLVAGFMGGYGYKSAKTAKAVPQNNNNINPE